MGARSGGGGGGSRSAGTAASGYRYNAGAIGVEMLRKTAKDFEDLSAMTYGKGDMGVKVKANMVRPSEKAKLKANGWTYDAKFKNWESPKFKTYKDWSDHAGKLIKTVKL